MKNFEEFFLGESVKPKVDEKTKKLKELIEMINPDVDFLYIEEHKDYFFEWKKDGKFITVFLSDYLN